jgi:hypothetical protein
MRSTESLDSESRRRTRRGAPALLLSLSLVIVTPAAGAQHRPPTIPRVITTWNAIATSTMPANPAAFLSYAFVHLAMYNAVNGITGEYELYQWNVHGPAKASTEAAAAAAAHRILSTYFPGAPAVAARRPAGRLPGAIPTAFARTRASATGCGRPTGSSSCAWETVAMPLVVPDRPATGRRLGRHHLRSAVARLVRPLALDSLTQLDPGPPPAIGSALYRAELAEVRAVGAAGATGSHVRSRNRPPATSPRIPFGPMQAGLRGVASARAVWTSVTAPACSRRRTRASPTPSARPGTRSCDTCGGGRSPRSARITTTSIR